MAKYAFDIGVIGAGAAGLTVAASAAQLGARTLLIEREDKLGGDCLHYGCVPSKALIKTAQVYHQILHTDKFGLPKVERPPVDFARVSGHIRAVIAKIQQHDSVKRFCRLGVRVEFGQAVFSDEHSVRLDDKTFTAAKWVIATGSSPAIPPLAGLDQTQFLTNREIFYLDRLPASMIVVGGGPIALEMAQAFSRLGSRIDVIQRSGQILSREDKDMADMVMARLNAEGVAFHVNTTLLAAKDLGREREIIYTDETGQTVSLKAEALLVALGRSPNVAGLNLEAIGLDFGHQGIRVDARLRTNHKHIYAAGDVIGSHQFTHAAGYEGGVVISNAIFHLPRRTDYTFLPWCTYTNPELASIGMNEKAARATGINYTVWIEEFRHNDRSLTEGEETGMIKLLLNEKDRPIGCQILGLHAGELINEWVAAMNGRLKLATLASAMHPYPTLGEINKRVAGKVLAKKIFSNKVRKALALFFSLKGRACECGN